MGLHIGDSAPDFSARDQADVVWTLDSSGNPFTLLTFWKTSCSACQTTFPYLARIAEGYPKLVTVIGVVQDASAEAGAALANEWGAHFPIISDRHPFPISRAYDPTVTPTMYFIDNDRKRIVARYQACVKADLNELSGRIAEFGSVPAIVVAPEGDGNPAWTPG